MGDTNRGIDLFFFESNPSWDITDTSWSAESRGAESSITFNIKLKRKPLYVLLTVIFPALLLSLLNVVTFVLPCEGGEKSGYAVTIFLSFVVFLTILDATLPSNSESVAVLSIYIVLMTFMSTSITVIVVIQNRCITWDESNKKIPGWMKTLANAGKCMSCRRKKKSCSTNKVGVANEEKEDGIILDDEESDTDTEYTWKTVINGIDAFCIYFFTSFSVISNVLFLVITSVNAYK